MLRVNEGLRTERLSGELVVLDADRGMVHRVSGDALAAYELIATGSPVPASLEDGAAHLVMIGLVVDETPTAVSRRWLVKAGTALSAGVVSMGLPRAAAAASGGDSGYAEGDLGAEGAPLNAPTISSATPGDASVTVAWSAVTGASSYQVYYKRTTETLYQLVTSPSGLTTSLVVGTLSNGVVYQFRVRAVSNIGSSGLSGVATATPGVNVAYPVTGATATLDSATVTLDNESGSSYSYVVGSGSSNTVTGQDDFTATGLSGSTVQITVSKTKAGVTKQSRVTLTRTTDSYGYTNTVATYTVPANGPRRVKVSLRGGTGAKGEDNWTSTGGLPGGPGVITDYMNVAAADTVKIAVGSGGGSPSLRSGGVNPLSFHNGGPGGTGNRGMGAPGRDGGGGGAASVVKHYTGATQNNIFIAGGSGGGGGASYNKNGGNGSDDGAGGGAGNGDYRDGGVGGSAPGDKFGSSGGGGGGGGASGGSGGVWGEPGTAGGPGFNQNNEWVSSFDSYAGSFTAGANGSISLEYYAVSITEQ